MYLLAERRMSWSKPYLCVSALWYRKRCVCVNRRGIAFPATPRRRDRRRRHQSSKTGRPQSSLVRQSQSG